MENRSVSGQEKAINKQKFKFINGGKYVYIDYAAEIIGRKKEAFYNSQKLKNITRVKVENLVYVNFKELEHFNELELLKEQFCIESTMFMEWLIEKKGFQFVKKELDLSQTSIYPYQNCGVLRYNKAVWFVYKLGRFVRQYVKWYRSHGIDLVVLGKVCDSMTKYELYNPRSCFERIIARSCNCHRNSDKLSATPKEERLETVKKVAWR